MAKSAALLFVPAPKSPAEEKDAFAAIARLLARSREDLRLAERVTCALRATGRRTLSAIEVTVQDGLVTLRGRVASYYLKQIAQETALTVSTADQVRNELEVARPG
jgi:osmotically-inducible protein OsmY